MIIFYDMYMFVFGGWKSNLSYNGLDYVATNGQLNLKKPHPTH